MDVRENETKNVATVTLATGSKYEINQDIYEQILQMNGEDYVLLDDMTSFKKSAVMEIEPIKEIVRDYPKLPPVNYEQIIKSAKTGKHLEALARGLKKVKSKFDRPTPQIDKLLQLARSRYKLI